MTDGGISLGIASETKAFKQGIDSGVIAPVQDAVAALDALGTSTGPAALDDNLKASQLATKQLGTETQEVASEIQQKFHATYQAVAQDTTDAFELSNREVNKSQKEILNTVSSSLAQNVAQSAQALDGTVNGALNALQNISTGIAVFGGPEIAAAAGVVTLLVSGIQGALNGAAESDKELNADISKTIALLEKSGDSKLTIEDIGNSLEALSQQTDGTDTSLSDLFNTARASKNDAAALADAYAGQTDALKDLDAAGKKRLETLQATVPAQQTDREAARDGTVAVVEQTSAQQKYNSYLDDALTKNKKAAEATKEYSEAVKALGYSSIAAFEAQQKYTSDTLASFDTIGDTLASETDDINARLASAQDSYNRAVADSAGKRTKAVLDAEAELEQASSQASKDTAADFAAQQDAQIKDLVNAGAAKIAIYEKFGKDAAEVITSAGSNTSLLESLANASPDQVNQIMNNYSELGSLAATNFGKDAQEIIANQTYSPNGVRIPVSADTTEFDQTLKGLDKRTVTIILNGVTRAGEKVF